MAKSLGQIHTANFIVPAVVTNSGPRTNAHLIDLAGELSNQLQTMVRQGNFFKVVGIDAKVSDLSGAVTSGVVSGSLNYYAPTRGRCEAYKNAYRAVRKGMELQGINVRGNRNYDFRVPLTPFSNYTNSAAFLNAATIDNTNELSLTGAAAITDDIYGVYNENIQPAQTAAVNFTQGFGLPGAPGGPTDFVLQEGQIFDPSLVRSASTSMESIPFQLAYNSVNTAYEMEWRPDPALYLAVMCGMFEVVFDQVDDPAGAGLTVSFAIHVSGWKSIMGNPDKKKSRRKSSKKMTSSRGRKK